MPDYLIADADLNFPGPTVQQVVAQVLARYKYKRPVTTTAVAKALGADKRIVEDRLQQAAQCRLLCRVFGGGWIPPIR